MKDFFEELFYMCSANNSKSRGLYIFILIAMIALAVGAVVSLVLLLVNLIAYKAFSVMWLGLLIVTVGILAGVIVWLKKS